MSEPVVWLTIFLLSVFVGIEVVAKVSSTLHTPLMSGANAIHGVILLGAVIVTGTTESTVALVVGLVAIAWRPATPAPSTTTSAGGTVPAAVMLRGKKRRSMPAATTAQR